MIFKSTKIIATIGPATRSQEMIIGLYKSGVNVIRLNFSHKNYEEKAMVIDLVHTLNAKGITKLSLLLDTKWPEIRTGKKETPTVYQVGDMITISTHSSDCAENDIYCDYPYLLDDLKVWDTIKIDSGMFDVEVMEIWTKSCIVKALNNATIW
jgi:pyruvate kinase